MAAKVALTQRSFARESVGVALGVGNWITSKSEKVSETSVLNMSKADETVSDAVSEFNVDAASLSRRRRWQQEKFRFSCSKLKLVDMYVMNF